MPDEDSIAGFVAQAAELDPQVKQRVINLANLAITEAEFMLQHGDPRIKATIVRSFMAVLAKQMQVKRVDTEIEELRGALQTLTTAVMGYKQVPLTPIDPNSDAELDTPHVPIPINR